MQDDSADGTNQSSQAHRRANKVRSTALTRQDFFVGGLHAMQSLLIAISLIKRALFFLRIPKKNP